MHEEATNVEKVRGQIEDSGVKRTAQLPTLFRRPCFVCMPAVRRWVRKAEVRRWRRKEARPGEGVAGSKDRTIACWELLHSGTAGMGSGAELTC